MVYRFLFGVLTLVILLNLLFSCHSKLSVETMQYATIGQKLYTQHCQNCHGSKGEGLGKLYPPLTDHAYFEANRSKLPCIVKYGLSGEIQVNGETYNQPMPGLPTITNVDIAYVLTYVTTFFGKSETHFKQEEIIEMLKNCP